MIYPLAFTCIIIVKHLLNFPFKGIWSRFGAFLVGNQNLFGYRDVTELEIVCYVNKGFFTF